MWPRRYRLVALLRIDTNDTSMHGNSLYCCPNAIPNSLQHTIYGNIFSRLESVIKSYQMYSNVLE